MKKALQILIILMLIGSICTAISFFVFDSRKAKNFLNKYSNSVTTHSHKENLKKDSGNSKKYYDDDFSDFVNKKANEFADGLTESILEGVSDGLTGDFADELLMDKDFSDGKIFGKYKKLLKTEKLGEFNQLHIKSPYLFSKVVKSDEYKIEFYSQNDNKDIAKHVDIREDGQKCEISCSERFNKDIPCMIIHTPNPQNLKLDLDIKDGFFSSQETFKSAVIEMDNGVLSLVGKESYDMDIEMDDGIIKMKFDNCDATVQVEGNSGLADILGKKHVLEDTKFEEKLKNARDSIIVKIDSGILSVK
ncbi:hypothetical protein HMPREF1142_0684 [Peptostreptococcaceae bacterium AS15]|nr:hypothetical protein HMPREF1142_0684 [Peptostreptococcaceae bacterium AS15]